MNQSNTSEEGIRFQSSEYDDDSVFHEETPSGNPEPALFKVVQELAYLRKGCAPATTSAYDSVPIELMATTRSVSWLCVQIEKEIKQTVKIKSSSSPTTALITFMKNPTSFKILNAYGEQIVQFKKTLKTDVPITLTLVFRPNTYGVHYNAIIIDTNSATERKIVSLYGYGGCANLKMRNAKSDLSGHKMIKLHPTAESQIFLNFLEFSNYGEVPGFVWIQPYMKDPRLSYWMNIRPSKFVVHPGAKMTVEITQKLENDDVKILLSGKDIGKVATLSVISGDEPSRLRLRRLVSENKVRLRDDVTTIAESFENEVDIDVGIFEDEPGFEDVFLKNLKNEEITAVIKRFSSFDETLLEEDETSENFVTL